MQFRRTVIDHQDGTGAGRNQIGSETDRLGVGFIANVGIKGESGIKFEASARHDTGPQTHIRESA